MGINMNGANKRFMAGKHTWLRNHLIIYNVRRGTANPYNQTLSTVGTELPVKEFDLRKVGGIQMENGSAGKEYELYGLDDLRKGSEPSVGTFTKPVRAYFLPWGSGKTYRGKLGSNADYFFTPTLNGCTFAHDGAGPNPGVAHSNFVNPVTTQADQGAMDADLTNVFGGAMPNRTLIKTNYKRAPTGEEDYRATVIGIRVGNAWRFYYQNYKAESLGTGKMTYTGLDLCIPI
jgi:hypothetical protein